MQGAIKPALEHLCDAYRSKASELAHDLLSLREQATARAELNHEKTDENQQLQAEVGAIIVIIRADVPTGAAPLAR